MLEKLLREFKHNLHCDSQQESRDRRQKILQNLTGGGLDSAEHWPEVIALSRDYDGFIREAATRRLADSNSPEALQAALVRLNDWVCQVRQAALSTCKAYLDKEHLPAMLASLGAILRLAGKSRADHTGFIDLVGAFVERADIRPTVLAFYPKSRGAVACFLLSRLLNCDGESLAKLVSLSTRHKDFLVRSRFLGACLEQGKVGEEALRVLLDDPHPSNRRKAFLALWQGPLTHEERQSLLPRVLLDPSGAVRVVALWAAKQSRFDLPGFVAAQGKGESLRQGAYLGWLQLLGAVGDDGCLPLVREAFADSRPKVRQSALLAWVALSRETADAPTAQAMIDVSPKVAKLAGQLLRKGRVALSGTQLQMIGEELEKRGDIGRLLAFSQRLSYWERLVHLAELLPRCEDPAAHAQIVGELAACLPRQRYGLGSLPVEQQERVRRAMRESGLMDVWRNHAKTTISWEQFV